jgi:heterodisulfide reductase subunit A-like polyferredoxin
LWIQSGGKKCGACLKKCAKAAIHLDAQDELVELEVGNIIVTTVEVFDAPHRALRLWRFPNVLTPSSSSG